MNIFPGWSLSPSIFLVCHFRFTLGCSPVASRASGEHSGGVLGHLKATGLTQRRYDKHTSLAHCSGSCQREGENMTRGYFRPCTKICIHISAPWWPIYRWPVHFVHYFLATSLIFPVMIVIVSFLGAKQDIVYYNMWTLMTMVVVSRQWWSHVSLRVMLL